MGLFYLERQKMANEDLQTDHEDDLEEGEELESGKESEGSDGDGRVKEGDDQHEDHQEENDALSEEEREAIRARRREERQRKKQAQKEREESLRRELAAERRRTDELAQRLSLIERKSTGSEIAQLDAKIKEASEASTWFKAQIAQAFAANDHAGAAEYTEKMVAAREEAQRLANIKTAYANQQQKPQTLDPRVKSYGEKFMSENRWLDLHGSDEDSRIALTVDAGLTREGWDPRTPEYWDEYKARLKKYLPHRYSSSSAGSEQRRESRKSVVTGSGRESASAGSKGEYSLSPERVQALKDAGAWDNPEKRAKMIKAYREYDKQSRS